MLGVRRAVGRPATSARPRKHMRDPRTDRTVRELACSELTHEHDSINAAKKRVYWGRVRNRRKAVGGLRPGLADRAMTGDPMHWQMDQTAGWCVSRSASVGVMLYLPVTAGLPAKAKRPPSLQG